MLASSNTAMAAAGNQTPEWASAWVWRRSRSTSASVRSASLDWGGSIDPRLLCISPILCIAEYFTAASHDCQGNLVCQPVTVAASFYRTGARPPGAVPRDIAARHQRAVRRTGCGSGPAGGIAAVGARAGLVVAVVVGELALRGHRRGAVSSPGADLRPGPSESSPGPATKYPLVDPALSSDWPAGCAQ
jgi:hypothetical protein